MPGTTWRAVEATIKHHDFHFSFQLPKQEGKEFGAWSRGQTINRHWEASSERWVVPMRNYDVVRNYFGYDNNRSGEPDETPAESPISDAEEQPPKTHRTESPEPCTPKSESSSVVFVRATSSVVKPEESE